MNPIKVLQKWVTQKYHPDQDPHTLLASLARQCVGIKEHGGDNQGKGVEMFQKAVDGKAQGEPWCAAFAMWCLKQVEGQLSIRSPLYQSESVWMLWHKSDVKCRSLLPKPGYLMCWNVPPTQKGHIGIVQRILNDHQVETVEGNSNNDGSREGNAVVVKTRTITGTPNFKVLGFLNPFPA